jgi:hypothetical protein
MQTYKSVSQFLQVKNSDGCISCSIFFRAASNYSVNVKQKCLFNLTNLINAIAAKLQSAKDVSVKMYIYIFFLTLGVCAVYTAALIYVFIL